jgi:hypothetical protein
MIEGPPTRGKSVEVEDDDIGGKPYYRDYNRENTHPTKIIRWYGPKSLEVSAELEPVHI